MKDIDSEQKSSRKIKPVGADGHRRRMFERFLSASFNFPPRDIVEMLLYYTIRVRDTRDSAVLLMERCGGNIHRLLSADENAICSVDGVGPSSAVFFNIVGELVSRLENPTDGDKCSTCDELESIFAELYPSASNNELWIAYFNSFGQLIYSCRTDMDIYRITPEDILSVVHQAKHCGAAKVAVGHFTCDLTELPTATDLAALKRIVDLLDLSGITLADYLVICPDEVIRLGAVL